MGNATNAYDKKVKGPGLLLGAKGATDAALPVARHPALRRRAEDRHARKPAEVDLIIGTAFKQLTTKADADKALAALAKPSPTPATRRSTAEPLNC